jgi:hypothetical protein
MSPFLLRILNVPPFHHDRFIAQFTIKCIALIAFASGQYAVMRLCRLYNRMNKFLFFVVRHVLIGEYG